MPKFYFTFGSSHSHLVAGTRFNMNRIAEIEADTMNEARDKAFKVFKDKWSFGYDNLVSAGVRQFNLDHRRITFFVLVKSFRPEKAVFRS